MWRYLGNEWENMMCSARGSAHGKMCRLGCDWRCAQATVLCEGPSDLHQALKWSTYSGLDSLHGLQHTTLNGRCTSRIAVWSREWHCCCRNRESWIGWLWPNSNSYNFRRWDVHRQCIPLDPAADANNYFPYRTRVEKEQHHYYSRDRSCTWIW